MPVRTSKMREVYGPRKIGNRCLAAQSSHQQVDTSVDAGHRWTGSLADRTLIALSDSNYALPMSLCRWLFLTKELSPGKGVTLLKCILHLRTAPPRLFAETVQRGHPRVKQAGGLSSSRDREQAEKDPA